VPPQRSRIFFLRALWAQWRATFGKLAWQYGPHRNGPKRQITFGSASVAGTGSVSVSVIYKQKGVLDGLIFDLEKGDKNTKSELAKCVDAARRNYKSPTSRKMHQRMPLGHESLSFHSYSFDRFSLSSPAPGYANITLVLDSFDVEDAKFQYRFWVGAVLDQIACWTN